MVEKELRKNGVLIEDKSKNPICKECGKHMSWRCITGTERGLVKLFRCYECNTMEQTYINVLC